MSLPLNLTASLIASKVLTDRWSCSIEAADIDVPMLILIGASDLRPAAKLMWMRHLSILSTIVIGEPVVPLF